MFSRHLKPVCCGGTVGDCYYAKRRSGQLVKLCLSEALSGKANIHVNNLLGESTHLRESISRSNLISTSFISCNRQLIWARRLYFSFKIQLRRRLSPLFILSWQRQLIGFALSASSAQVNIYLAWIHNNPIVTMYSGYPLQLGPDDWCMLRCITLWRLQLMFSWYIQQATVSFCCKHLG